MQEPSFGVPAWLITWFLPTTIKAIWAGDLRHRLNEGAGLYLRLFVNGGSHGWRFDYSLNGRPNTLGLGTYPGGEAPEVYAW
jgi:hypothetical protein